MNHREKPSFGSGEDKSDDEDDKADESVKEKEVQEENKITAQSSLSFQASQSPIFMVPCPSRLSTRMPSSKLSKPTPAFLPSSVAFHGRDLPLVRAVIQCDLPTEGGPTKHVQSGPDGACRKGS